MKQFYTIRKSISLLFLLMLLCSSSTALAADTDLIEEQIPVKVPTAGTLHNKINANKMFKIKNLKITGELNMSDINFIRQMAGCYKDDGTRYDGHLQQLDIKGVELVSDNASDTFDGIFSDLSSLQSVVLPEHLQALGSSAFSNSTALASVTLPEGLNSIGDNAFSGCTTLASITLPEGLVKLEGDVFYGCTGLTSVTLPKNLTKVSFGLFDGCTSLAAITLPESVTEIGKYAFTTVYQSDFRHRAAGCDNA